MEIIAFYGKDHFMSNLHEVEEGIYFDGMVFHSSEQIYAYLKADFFDDEEAIKFVLNAKSPEIIKKVLRTIPANHLFDADEWDKEKDFMMWKANFAKYSVPRLKRLLLATEGFELAEAAPRDTYWGTGYGKERTEEGETRGENRMGWVLETIRDMFAAEETDIGKMYDQINRMILEL